ncbi:MAG TPA: BTAD domain-containing putative transcriptional regulator [Gaiellaceae bacterium]|nr:BTAD domain-containing putative transcriptional regulator [Gaiellaceae bacterium]
MQAFRYKILGPLELQQNGRVVPIRAGKLAALLVVLLLRRNEVVSTDRLIETLWADEPPATSVKTLQLYVSQLRKLLPAATLLTQSPGYTLRVSDDELDLTRFERLLADGRRALASGNAELAERSLREGLGLWRGQPLADVAHEPFTQREIERLEELRLEALEERIEAQLASDKHAEVVAELEDLVREHPLRERPRGQLMLALYRCGRQAEALGAYREGAELLREQLGLEPSVELRQLEQAILRQDKQISARRQAPTQDKAPLAGLVRRRRNAVLAIVGVLVVAGGVSVALALHSNQPSARSAPAGIRPQTPLLSGSGGLHEVAQTPLPGVATGLATGFGSVWVRTGRVIHRIDTTTNRVVARIRVPGAHELYHTEVASGGGAVWTSNIGAGSVSRIDPKSNEIVATIPVWPNNNCAQEEALAKCSSPIGIATTERAVWVALHRVWRVVRIDPATNKVVATVPIGSGPAQAGPSALAAGHGQVYVGGNAWYGGDRFLKRIDSESNAVARVMSTPTGCDWKAADGEHVWLAVGGCGPYARGSVIEIDAATGATLGRVSLGAVPIGVTAGLGSIWAVTGDNELLRIHPGTHKITGRLSFPPGMALLTTGAGAVWLACQNGTVYRIEQ